MIAFGIILLALLGVPLFAIIGLSALLSFYNAEINSAAIFIELYREASNPTLSPFLYLPFPDLFSPMAKRPNV